MNLSNCSISLAPSVDLRNDPSQFTTEEWKALSRLVLPDPEPALVKQVLKEYDLLPEESASSGTTREAEKCGEMEGNDEKESNRKSGFHSVEYGSGGENQTSKQNSIHVTTFPKPPKQFSEPLTTPGSSVKLGEFLSLQTTSSHHTEGNSLNLRPATAINHGASGDVGSYASPTEFNVGQNTVSKRLDKNSIPLRYSSNLNTKKETSLTFPSFSVVSAVKDSLSIVPKVNRKGDNDAIAETILEVHHVELIDRGLLTTSSAELFLNATHIFLQHNLIEELDGLQLLDNLHVLVVHHNKIRSLQPLGILSHLTYLDVSNNLIEHVSIDWDFPDTLEVLDLRHNPCCPETNSDTSDEEKFAYRERVMLHLPCLVELDGKERNSNSEKEEEEGEECGKGDERTDHMSSLPSESIHATNKEMDTGALVIQESLLNHLRSPTFSSPSGSLSPASNSGLVSTPKKIKQEKQTFSMPGTEAPQTFSLPSRQGAVRRKNSSSESVPLTKKQRCGKKKVDSGEKTSRLVNESNESVVKGKKGVLKDIRAARRVAFELSETPEGEEDISALHGRKTADESLPYPTYDVALLDNSSSSKGPKMSNQGATLGTAALEGMLQQYQRRSTALIHAIQNDAMTAHPTVSLPPSSAEEEVLEKESDELWRARQVRNRARSDLDFASTVQGHHSKRSVEQLWLDVAKVLQTRNALVEDRRSRMRELTSQHSAAYLESLVLLKREHHVKDLDKYRRQNDPSATSRSSRFPQVKEEAP